MYFALWLPLANKKLTWLLKLVHRTKFCCFMQFNVAKITKLCRFINLLQAKNVKLKWCRLVWATLSCDVHCGQNDR